MNDPILQRFAATVGAIACFVVASRLPQFAVYLLPAGIGLLAAVHVPRPGDAPKGDSDAPQDR